MRKGPGDEDLLIDETEETADEKRIRLAREVVNRVSAEQPDEDEIGARLQKEAVWTKNLFRH